MAAFILSVGILGVALSTAYFVLAMPDYDTYQKPKEKTPEAEKPAEEKKDFWD